MFHVMHTKPADQHVFRHKNHAHLNEGLLPQEKCRTGHGIMVRFWCEPEPSLHQFIVAPWARRRKRVTASARANG